jgi:hypothetical protein
VALGVAPQLVAIDFRRDSRLRLVQHSECIIDALEARRVAGVNSFAGFWAGRHRQLVSIAVLHLKHLAEQCISRLVQGLRSLIRQFCRRLAILMIINQILSAFKKRSHVFVSFRIALMESLISVEIHDHQA